MTSIVFYAAVNPFKSQQDENDSLVSDDKQVSLNNPYYFVTSAVKSLQNVLNRTNGSTGILLIPVNVLQPNADVTITPLISIVGGDVPIRSTNLYLRTLNVQTMRGIDQQIVNIKITVNTNNISGDGRLELSNTTIRETMTRGDSKHSFINVKDSNLILQDVHIQSQNYTILQIQNANLKLKNVMINDNMEMEDDMTSSGGKRTVINCSRSKIESFNGNYNLQDMDVFLRAEDSNVEFHNDILKNGNYFLMNSSFDSYISYNYCELYVKDAESILGEGNKIIYNNCIFGDDSDKLLNKKKAVYTGTYKGRYVQSYDKNKVKSDVKLERTENKTERTEPCIEHIDGEKILVGYNGKFTPDDNDQIIVFTNFKEIDIQPPKETWTGTRLEYKFIGQNICMSNIKDIHELVFDYKDKNNPIIYAKTINGKEIKIK
ncbi:Hypothetical protein ORPV_92 [Orpheovirus IHUMI-LCC2]|uniref:Uncharacterized protein n=1 Tax=Orpheovirus IHUMI-LCC2 TaxID=2023057 RepID=A0A2I2L392_9VIRU|nr:Hypothetical protein ORPV_92 [Orpheovirus IHUMI-LCC2]SNW61996.1 Hypothetical protein ORPV_92 [Orpheovirus IHUMI-LCC2]